MAINVGAWPIDPTTEVGLFRFQIGDVVGTEITPATDPPTAEFEFMSDATIEALLAANPDAIGVAKGQALLSMATQLITAAQDIQVDDIRIKTVERAKLMMELAAGYGVNAGSADAATAFEIVPLNSRYEYYAPQGTPEWMSF